MREKETAHLPFPLSVEIRKLLIQNTIPRSFLPEQDRWPESHFHCSATLSWQLIWNSAISNPLHTVCQGIMYITGFMAPLIWQIPWFLKPKDWWHWIKAWVSVLWELWGVKYNEETIKHSVIWLLLNCGRIHAPKGTVMAKKNQKKICMHVHVLCRSELFN